MLLGGAGSSMSYTVVSQVQTKNGDWFSSFEEVPENKRSWVRPSMFPTDDMESLNIHRW